VITSGVAEGRVGALANEKVNPDRFARMVAIKEELGQPQQLWLAAFDFIFCRYA
jgi:hypothetical protein